VACDLGAFISLSRKLVSDHGSAVFGIASARMKLARLYASGWSWRRTALAAKVWHDSRVDVIAPLPSLIHCSAVPPGCRGDNALGGGKEGDLLGATEHLASVFAILARLLE
jgi:hypothetical protein